MIKTFKTYRDYFREVYQHTPHWGRVRKLVSERAKGMCEMCLEQGSQAHHLEYKTTFHFEDRHLHNMMWVCPECHKLADWYRRHFGMEIVDIDVVKERWNTPGDDV